MKHAGSSEEARRAATAIATTLREAGFTAYFAGGCVRDELLDLHPTDYDVATDARPDDIRPLFRNTAHVGASFGVVLVKERGITVEVATFRADGPYTDRRRPDAVEFSDEVADAKRRDFTINALFLDPLAADEAGVRGARIHGHVIDHVGGLQDLEGGLVRAVGDPDARLGEDHLRALRAVRFAARLSFDIEQSTRRAITEHARDLLGVSRERIGEELRRMLAHPARARAVELLQELELDAPVLNEEHMTPEPTLLKGLGEGPSFATCLAALAIDRGSASGEGDVGALVSRWRNALSLSNDERDELRDVLNGFWTLGSAFESAPMARQKRVAASAWFEGAMRLLAARDPGLHDRLRELVRQLERTPGGLVPEPFLNGEDLIALGAAPGPRFRPILDRVYDAQLEGRVKNRDEALELARSLGV